ncbi:MAG: hypothetical protein DRP01_04345 [Archaeoglobales archaeon]|nr:MAG: hypothetical protein DRP01_04345 [Archaeoglobales archaeon]
MDVVLDLVSNILKMFVHKIYERLEILKNVFEIALFVMLRHQFDVAYPYVVLLLSSACLRLKEHLGKKRD